MSIIQVKLTIFWRRRVGSIIGTYWEKNGQIISIQLLTNKDRIDVANIIKNNLETLGFKTEIRELNNNYYKSNLEKLKYDILLTGSTVSIKPEIQKYLDFNMEKQHTEKETYDKMYEKFKERPNFMVLYFNSITIISSKNLRGNFKGNWYNIFYNIDTWYKIKDN